jgi:predicted transport protein
MTIIVSKSGKNAQKIETSKFPNEDYLQKYITENPESIPLNEIKDNTKLLIIAREFGTNSGPIDALGIDQDGEIYIIETKLYKNPDKRKVVAQVLDYGASLWKNSVDYESFVTSLEKISQTSFGVPLNQRLTEFFGLDDDGIGKIHDTINHNLREGVIKFVVLMDRLSSELKDLITFVNQNSKFDIYAVELEYYKHDENEIMIPKLYGSEVRKTTKVRDVSGPREESHHTENVDDSTKMLYDSLKEQILKFGDDVKIVPWKFYIAFKRNTNFLDVVVQKSKLLVYLNLKWGEMDEPKGLARDVSDTGVYGNGDYEFSIKNPNEIEYVVSLAKKSYDKN